MWEINLAEQTTAFLLSVALGVILCILYDFLRAYRKIKSPSVISVFVQDIVYFLIAAVLTFLLMLITTLGQIRGYVFIGIIIGFALCRISLSVIIFKILVVVLGLAQKVFGLIKQKTRLCFNVLFQKTQNVADKISKIFKNVVFYRKKLLHTNTDIVYNDHSLSKR